MLASTRAFLVWQRKYLLEPPKATVLKKKATVWSLRPKASVAVGEDMDERTSKLLEAFRSEPDAFRRKLEAWASGDVNGALAKLFATGLLWRLNGKEQKKVDAAERCLAAAQAASADRARDLHH